MKLSCFGIQFRIENVLLILKTIYLTIGIANAGTDMAVPIM